MSRYKLFAKSHALRPQDIQSLIDFRGGDSYRESMAGLQWEGVAALYNILCHRKFAYLADEVGTGKTYQALGLAALVWYLKPTARVLFITPRENVQNGWLQDYRLFFANNYLRALGGDDRVSSLLLREPLRQAVKLNNLREWVPLLNYPDGSVAVLRHSSFTKPVFLRKTDDPNVVWEKTRNRLREYGLQGLPRKMELRKPEEASLRLNLEFAKSVNRLLEGHDNTPYFDLVIVDEAQSLRNPKNQTNRVLFQALRGQVDRWLFLSATPAHSGVEDIARVLNHYPEVGEVIQSSELSDLESLQKRLGTFMVRRRRAYRIGDLSITKDRYRADLPEAWAETSDKALPTLAMGLVQKHLVPILQQRSNRYQIGFLSSFESLQSSVRHLERVNSVPERTSDFYHDSTFHNQDHEAPDTGFIDRLTERFSSKFDGRSLPHPKLDRVVSEVARLAFGESGETEVIGGEKTLVFTRRVSTVEALRQRLETRYLASVMERVRRCWGRELDWSSGPGGATAELPDEHFEWLDEEFGKPGTSPLRRAMAKGGWLYRFRATLVGSGSNALLFEENWLERLCRAGGRDPRDVAQDFPEDLWAKSWLVASYRAGKEYRQHRAVRAFYLALEGLRHDPQLFGLDTQHAQRWKIFLERISGEFNNPAYGRHVEPHPAPELFGIDTLWSAWNRRFKGDHDLVLPGEEPNPTLETLYRRQVLKTLIGQSMRLSDTLIDLYCAGLDGERAERFIRWLASNDRDARRLRNQYADWIHNLDTILTSGLGEVEPMEKLAQRSIFKVLTSLEPVVGITGGSGGNSRATAQFRTPGYPQIIVCTDTLKEGVNLHLFCDRVVHYGVAWTSGDLEQRIGRVDRYFSRIERRLQASRSSGPLLEIYYPHVANSLERGQVQRVLERKRRIEQLMDSPLASGLHESRELSIDGEQLATDEQKPRLSPFPEPRFPRRGVPDLAVDWQGLWRRKRTFEQWACQFAKELNHLGIVISGDPSRFDSRFWLDLSSSKRLTLSWRFSMSLGRYLLVLDEPLEHFNPSLAKSCPFTDPVHPGAARRQALCVQEEMEQDARLLAKRLYAWRTTEEFESTRYKPWNGSSFLGDDRFSVEERLEAQHYCISIHWGRRNHIVEVVQQAPGLFTATSVIADKELDNGTHSLDNLKLRKWARHEGQGLPFGTIESDAQGRLLYAACLGVGANNSNLWPQFVEAVSRQADAAAASLLMAKA